MSRFAETIVYGIIVCVIGFIIFSVWYKTTMLGSKSEHYGEICIQDHVYFRANFMGKMGIAIKLDDDGKPIKCKKY